MNRALVLLLLTTALLAVPVKSKKASSKPAAKPSLHSARATSRYSRAGVRGKLRGSARRTHAPPAPSYQLHPEPERYTQIQQALADRGYFKGAVNGEWGSDSVDALQRFQTDQKLDADGKISALSLTGLGLGPKHDGSTAATVPAPGAPPAAVPTASAQNAVAVPPAATAVQK